MGGWGGLWELFVWGYRGYDFAGVFVLDQKEEKISDEIFSILLVRLRGGRTKGPPGRGPLVNLPAHVRGTRPWGLGQTERMKPQLHQVPRSCSETACKLRLHPKVRT